MSPPVDSPRPRRIVAPLAPAAIACACGVVADRFGPQGPTVAWGVVSAIGAIALFRRPRGRAGLAWLVLAFAGLGAAWHHARWTDLDADSLALADWSTPRPAWVRGVLVETPRFRPGEWADRDGQTLSRMDVTAISDGLAWHPASGRVDLAITGDREDLSAGAPVFAAGSLGAIPGPRNPGESDRRERERAEGVRLRLSVGESTGVWPDPDGHPRALARWLGRVRQASYDRLVAGLAPDVSALAAALLLGRREGVDPDVNDAFARTGTTHLLAISGLHLQALALALFFAFRLLGLGRKPSLVGVLLATILYALLVGLMPSVVRSAAMTVMACLAGLCDRGSAPANRLSAAALATLALNPSWLFDAGCQLSFLAVVALFWGVPMAWPRPRRMDPDDHATPEARLDALERRLEPRGKSLVRRAVRLVAGGLVASLVVWAATVPLVAWRFHIVAPIGVLLNLPLVPITTLALLCAGMTLASALVWAPLAVPWSWACGELLRVTARIVAWGASRREGWAFTAGPSTTMTLLFYALLALAAWATLRRWPSRHTLWASLAAQAAVAAGLVLWPDPPPFTEAEVLAVDHGLAVAIRSRDGRTFLYDCGKMRDPRVGRRVIAPALWARGAGRIDGVILSHADSDHYDGLPDLLERFAVGEVRVPPGFGSARNPEAAALLRLVRDRGVPVREIVAGDRIDLGGGATATALHPPRDWAPEAPDNARSVALDVEADGRHLLLTGDLEGPGLAQLVTALSPRVDAMLSPHHGSLAANAGWVYEWADPRRVVVSQARPKPSTRDPLAVAGAGTGGMAVDRTWDRGAILLRFQPDGLEASGFLDEPPPLLASVGLPLATIAPAGPRAAVAVLGVIGGAGLCLALTIVEWGAWTLVLPGRRRSVREAEPPPWEPIEAIADDGVTLRGAWLEPEGPAVAAVLFLHGFGEDRSGMKGRAEALVARGFAAAIVDSRGRRESGGAYTAFGGFEAADAARWLDAIAPRAPRVLAWGRSMGAAVAARAAAGDPRIVGLILEAPYADLGKAVAAWLGLLRLPGAFAGPMLARAKRLAGVSLRDPKPIAIAERVATPVLILHGTADPVCSAGEVTRLALAFAGSVDVIEVAGAKHGDVFDLGGPDLADRVARWASGAPVAP